jgi:outer membrane protein OmpA-like peptidoglycan-associated protein
MKYRVTTRGWVVFSVLGILVIVLIASMYNNSINKGPKLVNEELTIIEENNVVDDKSDIKSTIVEEDDSEESSEITDQVNPEEVADTVIEEDLEIINTIDETKETTILFSKNISELDDAYIDELNEWIKVLKDCDNTITVEGHINGYPYYNDGDYGLSLAESRANIVKAFMVEQGIDDKRILIVNMGSNKQVTETENYHLNRRVVIYFNEKP